MFLFLFSTVLFWEKKLLWTCIFLRYVFTYLPLNQPSLGIFWLQLTGWELMDLLQHRFILTISIYSVIIFGEVIVIRSVPVDEGNYEQIIPLVGIRWFFLVANCRTKMQIRSQVAFPWNIQWVSCSHLNLVSHHFNASSQERIVWIESGPWCSPLLNRPRRVSDFQRFRPFNFWELLYLNDGSCFLKMKD